ncbi:short chain dehydrogenase [Truncatella angustata]|uniref:Short chain dehydrogenase n=1 Tax=Truncatella angustata TaxID=152316 RepID=A0A9P8UY78_9PEZI|nr:short chain dehydrogenase [Truncatella angustata]KAH6660565.1 short chain dehydrogenase [Truncatella angustata]
MLTKVSHTKPYAALSPLHREVSQAGRTVLITGGNGGIGYAAAFAFGQAGAPRVIITGRRADATAAAAKALEKQLIIDGNSGGISSNTEFVGVTCDISKPEEVERLWADLKADGVYVDVLVLNAAGISARQSIFERGTDGIWTDYNVNVRAQLQTTERFYKQETGPSAADSPQKSLVMLSTVAIHDFDINAPYPGYGLTKNAGTLLMQVIAREISPEAMQIVSFHPGAVFTQNAKTAGWKEADLDWHDPNLAGQFAVWAASEEARFLHGRYVWSEWDLDELKNGDIRKRIDEDENFLRIGVHGL